MKLYVSETKIEGTSFKYTTGLLFRLVSNNQTKVLPQGFQGHFPL